eukprot:48242-Prorocentrum_minimum.AAC.2
MKRHSGMTGAVGCALAFSFTLHALVGLYPPAQGVCGLTAVIWQRCSKGAYLQYKASKCVTKYCVRYDAGNEEEYTDTDLITKSIVFLRNDSSKRATTSEAVAKQ